MNLLDSLSVDRAPLLPVNFSWQKQVCGEDKQEGDLLIVPCCAHRHMSAPDLESLAERQVLAAEGAPSISCCLRVALDLADCIQQRLLGEALGPRLDIHHAENVFSKELERARDRPEP